VGDFQKGAETWKNAAQGTWDAWGATDEKTATSDAQTFPFKRHGGRGDKTLVAGGRRGTPILLRGAGKSFISKKAKSKKKRGSPVEQQ